MELAANDWGTLITRRAVKEPIEKGGWKIFHTWLVGPDMANPAINFPCAASARRRGSAGRPTRRWRSCATPGSMPPIPRQQKRLIDDVQKHALEFVPFIPTAQFIMPTAYRSNISGPDDLADRLPVERREEIGSG